jgi:hypothetical protein
MHGRDEKCIQDFGQKILRPHGRPWHGWGNIPIDLREIN